MDLVSVTIALLCTALVGLALSVVFGGDSETEDEWRAEMNAKARKDTWMAWRDRK